MKLEIEIQDKPKVKKTKQDFILTKLLAEIQESLKLNKIEKFLELKRTYDQYVNSLNGRAVIGYGLKSEIRNVKSDYVPKFNNRTDLLAIKKSNTYLTLLAETYKVKDSHIPKENNFGKWIGVEIECYVPCEVIEYTDENDEVYETEKESRGDFKARLKRAIENNRIKYVSIKEDGSLSGFDNDKGYTVEFTILTRIDDMSNLKKLCAYLSNLGAEVNQTCGLHIHLDQRDVIHETKVLSSKVQRFNRVMPLLKKLVPSSRLSNSYCITDKSSLRNGSRYYAINTDALKKFKTIEIRLHSGTTDFKKISNWIMLCYAVSHCEAIKNSDKHNIDSVTKLRQYLGAALSEETYQYLESRVLKFNPVSVGPVDNRTIESNEFNTDNQIQPSLPTEVNTINVPF